MLPEKLLDCPIKNILPDSGGLQPPSPPAHTPMRPDSIAICIVLSAPLPHSDDILHPRRARIVPRNRTVFGACTYNESRTRNGTINPSMFHGSVGQNVAEIQLNVHGNERETEPSESYVRCLRLMITFVCTLCLRNDTRSARFDIHWPISITRLTGWAKNCTTAHQSYGHSSVKSLPIFKILPLKDSAVNCSKR